MRLRYVIDGTEQWFEGDPASAFACGRDECLSALGNDPARSCDWYPQGFACIASGPFFDAQAVRQDVEAIVRRIVAELAPERDLRDFQLEKYHRFVDERLHRQVIGRTRRLYPRDFGFDEQRLVSGLGDLLGDTLGYDTGAAGFEQWIIVRINPPGSKGFNPAHKDIYETFDASGIIPRMINVWIPICGVGNGTGLPLAPASHLVPEAEILRTRAGSTLDGQAYSVNSIKSWAGRTDLVTQCPAPDEMLILSSHLIHGLGRNRHADTTRVSLEFRLYAQSPA